VDLAFKLFDFFVFFGELPHEISFELGYLVSVLLLELVEAVFPVLRRHSDFSIQFHHVSHLVLEPE